tara:strand:- start:4109 stop:4246 length:138 start_codon:yes stop_codon:yes gene_type:complete
MIMGLIMKPISAALDIILVFIPKKLLLAIVIALIAGIYFGYNYDF